MIPFSKPYYNKKCLNNIDLACKENISFIKKCEELLVSKYDFPHCILTTSCTHALEMMAMILDIGHNDEVIIPSYTFVSTANAFVKFGATIKCVDSLKDNPNIDSGKIEQMITKKTKALVIVHYAGSPCNMEEITKICKKHNIFLLEDAAQAINSYYNKKAIGTFGILSAFSFHSTKNINCGEGGLLVINDKKLINKSHIICDKGTNRYDFSIGKIDKYQWIDKGSSYPMSELNAAYLYYQLENIDEIINGRKEIWKYYQNNLKYIESKNICKLSKYPGNYHIFYIVFNKNIDLLNIEKYLKKNQVNSNTHYIPIHKSKYFIENFENVTLSNSEHFGNNLLRLPLYSGLKIEEAKLICNLINNYFTFNIKHIKHKNINQEVIKDIIKLKSQFWLYENKSQMKWIDTNVKINDIHILLYKDSNLIGYGLIMNRNCNIIDSVIIDKNYRGIGYGGYIMNYINNIIKKDGFLLCEKHNILYYKKYGWDTIIDIKTFNKEIRNDLYKMKYRLEVNEVIY